MRVGRAGPGRQQDLRSYICKKMRLTEAPTSSPLNPPRPKREDSGGMPPPGRLLSFPRNLRWVS